MEKYYELSMMDRRGVSSGYITAIAPTEKECVELVVEVVGGAILDKMRRGLMFGGGHADDTTIDDVHPDNFAAILREDQETKENEKDLPDNEKTSGYEFFTIRHDSKEIEVINPNEEGWSTIIPKRRK